MTTESLKSVVVDNGHCHGEVFLLGSQVTSFVPKGSKELLFVSKFSQFQPGTAIRGGIPICFPWFGPKQDGEGPSHGLARTTMWEKKSSKVIDDGSHSVVMEAHFGPLKAQHQVCFGPLLSMELLVENTGDKEERIEHAHHTYFRVSQIKNIEVFGLQNTEYLDKLENYKRFTEKEKSIRFSGETDRVYLNTKHRKIISDPGYNRRIVIDGENNKSTVVWNPWIEKAKRLSHFGDDEWTEMVCVETGNIAENAIALGPGQSHWAKTTLEIAD